MISGASLWTRGALAAGVLAVAAAAAGFDLEGHRGTRGLAPENTLAAFRRALAIGVTTIETDVAITRDLVPVISHDPRLNPVIVRDDTGRWLREPGPPIHSLTLAELAAYDVGRIDPDTPYARSFPLQQAVDGERIPTLRAVLALAARHTKPVRLNIETKITPDGEVPTADPATFVRLILAAADAAGMRNRIMIQSFDWRSLLEAKRIAPDVPTACLTIETQQSNTMASGADGRSPWHAGLRAGDYDSVPRLVKAAGCAVWSPFFRNVTGDLVQRAHALGVRVIPWTVNETTDMGRLIDLGVDGLISDYPDRLRTVMSDKGLALP